MHSPWLGLVVAPAFAGCATLWWRYALKYQMRLIWGYGNSEGRPVPRTLAFSRYFGAVFLGLMGLLTLIHAV